MLKRVNIYGVTEIVQITSDRVVELGVESIDATMDENRCDTEERSAEK